MRWNSFWSLTVLLALGCGGESNDEGGSGGRTSSGGGGNATGGGAATGGTGGKGSGGAAGSGGTAGGAAGSGGSSTGGSAGQDGTCSEDAECDLIRNCCECTAVPRGETSSSQCDEQCIVEQCAARGVVGARCVEGRCVEAYQCDLQQASCLLLPPTCPEGQVLTVVGSCFGDCVPSAQCAPDTAD